MVLYSEKFNQIYFKMINYRKLTNKCVLSFIGSQDLKRLRLIEILGKTSWKKWNLK